MIDAQTPDAPGLPAKAWQQIASWLVAADIDCIEIGAAGRTLRMVRHGGVYQVEPVVLGAAALPRSRVPVVAPCAGVLLEHHPLGGCSIPREGDRVKAGQLVCLLQLGLLLAPVVAPTGGILGALQVAAGTPVGYGTRVAEILEQET